MLRLPWNWWRHWSSQSEFFICKTLPLMELITEIKINMRSSSLSSVLPHVTSICIQQRMQGSLHFLQKQYVFAHYLKTVVNEISLSSWKTVHGSYNCFTRVNIDIREFCETPVANISTHAWAWWKCLSEHSLFYGILIPRFLLYMDSSFTYGFVTKTFSWFSRKAGSSTPK